MSNTDCLGKRTGDLPAAIITCPQPILFTVEVWDSDGIDILHTHTHILVLSRQKCTASQVALLGIGQRPCACHCNTPEIPQLSYLALCADSSIQMVVTELNNLSAWVNKMSSAPLCEPNRLGVCAQEHKHTERGHADNKQFI